MFMIRKKCIAHLLVFVSIFLFSLNLSACKFQNVSEKTIISDIQNVSNYSIHEASIDDINIIKRQSDNEQDIIYLNVKGKNDLYSVSLNYKMIYYLFDDGWHLESVDEYNDEENFQNEFVPLTGPSKDDIDNFVNTLDIQSYASYKRKGFIINTKSEFIDTGILELSKNYGKAEYRCEITIDYSFVKETVTFPVIFRFTEIFTNGTMGWQAYIEDDLDSLKRDVNLNEDICGKWRYKFQNYEVNLLIDLSPEYSSSNENLQRKQCRIEEYEFVFGNEKFSTSGVMNLVPKYSKKDGTISSLELIWADEFSKHPKECANLHFSNIDYMIENMYADIPNEFSLVSYYNPNNLLPGYKITLMQK